MTENLAIPKNTIEIIQKHNFVFRKQFGQNFLIDPRVLERIVESSGVGPEDCVLEIGPGIGTMTRKLAEYAKKVIAVEIDANLIPILQETLADLPNVELIHNDIMKVDIRKLCEEQNEGKPIHVVANLPYYITTPIIMGLFESGVPLRNVTVMVRKEVADRMQAGPGTKDYGALSLAVQYYSKAEIVANVPANCFMPRPKVGSAVIRLSRFEDAPVQVADSSLMFRIIRAAFGQRRKTLSNALSGAPDLGLTKQQAQEAIEAAGFSPTIRGEALTLKEFAKLADTVGQMG